LTRIIVPTTIRRAACKRLSTISRKCNCIADEGKAVEAIGKFMRISRPVPLVVATVLLGLFLVLYTYASRVPSSSGAPRPIDKVRAVAAGEAVARASVGDPESARFRHSFASEKWKVPATCGEVNYKRATGGYAGFQRFVAAGPVAQLEEDMSGEQFRRLWSVMCEPDE
jgi:hypothetical protein